MKFLVLDYEPAIGGVINVQKANYKVLQVRKGFHSGKYMVIATPTKKNRR